MVCCGNKKIARFINRGGSFDKERKKGENESVITSSFQKDDCKIILFSTFESYSFACNMFVNNI